MRFLLPLGTYRVSRSLTLVIGVFLIYLSFQLLRRRRLAWWMAVGASAATVLAHLLRIDQWQTALVPAAALTGLLVFRKKFSVRSEPARLWQALAGVVAIVLLATTYGVIGFELLEKRDFGREFFFWDAVVRTLRQLVFIGNSDLIPATRYARYFLTSLNVIGIVSLAAIAIAIFRPLAYRFRTLPYERELARAILKKSGTSSIDFFKTWHDKSFFFSEDSHCFISYRVAMGVAISLGDPSGPEECRRHLIPKFLAYCSDNGWTAAFHQTLPDMVSDYRSLGLRVLKIGEEGVVDLDHFCTKTAEVKWFRYVRRRFETGGYTVERHVPPHVDHLVDEVEEVSREWLSLPGRRERGFTLGKFEPTYMMETPLFVLRDQSRSIIAFMNEIPSYRPGEATIDLMRHRVEIPTGAMDYLFATLMCKLRDEGYTRFSLGLAPFSGVGENPGAPLQERVIHEIGGRLNLLFSYKGLRNYKAKFEPVWEDRFLVYQGGPPGLVNTALALTRVTER
jgi:phosphatidylglycerol lysyltransferase